MSTTLTASASTPSKGLNIVLWILQVLLAALFMMTGFMKLATSIEKIGAQMPWVLNYPPLLIRFIGLSEILGAIGLIVPSLTRIKPDLTVWAAYGLALIMALATVFHISRGEYSHVVFTLLILAMAFFIAWGRSKKVPIAAR